MKKRLSAVMLVMILVGFVGLIGYEAHAEGAVTIKGTVQVARDEDFNATAVKVADTSKEPAVSYSIVLNARGTDMADAVEGEEAEITGTVAKKGDARWLTVTSYKAVETDDDYADQAPDDEADE